MSSTQPLLDRDLIEIVAELGRASRLFQRENAFCEGVTFTQFVILDRVVESDGRLGLSDLHDALEVDKSTTTRLVAPLLKRGLLLKQRSTTDGRAFELVVTDEGCTVTATVWACVTGAVEILERFIPEGERGDTYRGVRVFLQALKRACEAGCCTPDVTGGGCCR